MASAPDMIDRLKKENARLKRDIKKLNHEVSETRAYYENIIALLPNHVYWLDTNNAFLGCNNKQAKNSGLSSPREIVGLTNFDLPWKEHAEDFNELNNLIMRTGEPQTREETAFMANDGIRTYLSRKVPLRNTKQEIVGTLGISVDITEKKELERRLIIAKAEAEAANDAKSEFLANMSHDLRTPLSGIIGLSEVLGHKLKNQNNIDLVNLINNSGVKLLELLDNILEVISNDKIEKIGINNKKFNLLRCINDAIILVMPSIKLKFLDFNLKLDDKLPEDIISDKTKIDRILLNLLSNAVKFTEAGFINLTVQKRDNNEIKFIISDSGIGISQVKQEKIFDRFYKANPSYEGLYAGCGLGLHIAENFTSMLGGHIEVDSEEGKGSTFSFTIPIDSQLTMSHKKSQDMDTINRLILQEKSVDISSHEVLIVEDNTITLRIFKSYAAETKTKIIYAESGEMALDILETKSFDIIITDIGLPGISGYDLTKLIREQETKKMTRAATIVGLTAHALKDAQEKCMEVGMNYVFNKPISLETFRNIITNLA